MKGLLIRFGVTAVAVFLASAIIPGIEIQTFSAGIAAVLVLSLLNALIRPILYFFSLPFIVLTLGLFMVIVNALLLQLVGFLVKGFVIHGFWSSVFGAVLISLVSMILNAWISDKGHIEVIHHQQQPPKVINPD